MNLDEAQKKRVATWIAEGLKLSEIQQRLVSELGINLTYMEVRFLVDDLKLTPKDVEPPKTAQLPPAPPSPASPVSGQPANPPPASAPGKPGQVSVTVDEIARPGTVASGRVTFSDGNSAEWYLDEMGRLGLMPQQQGYRPSPADVQTFQRELQNELSRLGL
jgi:hypothetical protein